MNIASLPICFRRNCQRRISFWGSLIMRQWNPTPKKGLGFGGTMVIKRQEIVVRYGYKVNGAIEWIKAGTFYMSEWDTPSNGITAKFTAVI